MRQYGTTDRFLNSQDALKWESENTIMLKQLHAEVREIEAVAYSEFWACGASPSFVAGFNDADEMIVCFPI